VSTSLPFSVQYDFIRSIEGLGNAEIIRPGYAVEYDYCDPTQLFPTLETKRIEGLYFAGQINGTSGYEEAAGQGLVAGANAGLKVLGGGKLVLNRVDSYIGVMIDDLVTKGVEEPYRMFTSRAEHRLLLRHDNADRRLRAKAAEVGLVCDQTLSETEAKWSSIGDGITLLQSTHTDKGSLEKMLRQPAKSWRDLPEEIQGRFESAVWDQVEIEIKNAGYIARQEALIQRTRDSDSKQLAPDLDYLGVSGLKREAQLKLNQIKPTTLGQASRISGITPADISLLSIWIEKNGKSVPRGT
ncbi:MAG: FAD-dependent oxidoreductase, partial [Verrucomicrobiota bacterium]